MFFFFLKKKKKNRQDRTRLTSIDPKRKIGLTMLVGLRLLLLLFVLFSSLSPHRGKRIVSSWRCHGTQERPMAAVDGSRLQRRILVKFDHKRKGDWWREKERCVQEREERLSFLCERNTHINSE